MNLPDTSGLDLIEAIRRYSGAPLIIISGQPSVSLKIQSFEHGADDYVQKPFDIDELVARIKAHIRRTAHTTTQEPTAQTPVYLSFDRWVLDRARFQLYDQAHHCVDLTTREFQLLEALLLSPQRTLRRRDLCEVIREDRYVPTPRAIDVKITRIRKKIGDSAVAPRIIKTIRGVGYVIECDIHASCHPSAVPHS